jgi:hypothetical protein
MSMKKSSLLILSFLFSVVTMAQEQPAVQFGVRAGASISNLQGQAVSSLQNLLDFSNGAVATSGRTGFFAGGYISLPMGTTFSIVPALYYTQKGYVLTGDLNIKGADFLGINAKAALNTSYIDLPLLLKANLSGLQVFAGPQVSYLTNATLRTTAGVLGFNLLNTSMDARAQFSRWDAALTGGIGYQFANGLNLTAAYDHGLVRTDNGNSLNAYNRAFKIGLGYAF